PDDRLVGDATYWLGESMFQRQRFRDAAEAFLKVSTKYESSAKAPDALLRLGQSLAALGEKEAACASLGEVLRKFPRASAGVKQGVDEEQKRARCCPCGARLRRRGEDVVCTARPPRRRCSGCFRRSRFHGAAAAHRALAMRLEARAETARSHDRPWLAADIRRRGARGEGAGAAARRAPSHDAMGRQEACPRIAAGGAWCALTAGGGRGQIGEGWRHCHRAHARRSGRNRPAALESRQQAHRTERHGARDASVGNRDRAGASAARHFEGPPYCNARASENTICRRSIEPRSALHPCTPARADARPRARGTKRAQYVAPCGPA